MIERIDDMPEGTVGFRASGKVTRDDYRDVLAPAMRQAAEAGEVRLLYVAGPDFENFEAGALLEDTKAGLELGLGHYSAWKRCAIVTDVEWMQRAIHMLGWMSPGEVMVAGLDQLDEAKSWVAA